MITVFAPNPRILRNIGYTAISLGTLVFVFFVVDLGALQETLFSVRAGTLALSSALILISVLAALLRFRVVLKSFGYLPSWRDTFVAFSLGQASNLIFLNIIGQSLSRAAILSQAKVPAGVSVIMTYWERGLAAGILFLFSVAGGWFLFANSLLNLQAAAAYLIYVFGSLMVVSTIVAVTILGPTAARSRAKYWVGVGLRMWPSVALTLISQICMLAAYLVILMQVGGISSSLAIISAIAVVMFAASLPISFSGWGVRELTSVQILGAIGIGSSFAVTTAIAIGLISLVVLILFSLLGMWLFVRRAASAAPAAIDAGVGGGFEWTSFTTLFIALLTSVLIFFQVRLATSGGAVTANISDVIAITALGLTFLLILRQRSFAIFPRFFSLGLLAISAVFILALAIGWSRYGLNQWAIVNRGFGWIIILGYLAAGGALVWADKSNGRVLVLWSFALAGAAVAGLELALLLANLLNVNFPADTFVVPLRGYAGNSNAFALQMIMTVIAAITAHRLGAGSGSRTLLRVILVITLLATFYSLSRSGLGTFLGAIFLLIVLSTRAERRERLFDGLVVAAAVLVVVVLPDILSAAVDLASQMNAAVNPSGGPIGLPLDNRVLSHMEFSASRSSSDNERWQSILAGWNLWREYPVFGAGLGAFVQNRFDAGLPALIIHSVPVWIGAELGVLGFGVIGAVFIGLVGLAIKMLRDTEYFAWGAGLLVMLAALAVSGSVHDFFFQRSFWFLLGIFAGVYGNAGLQARRSGGEPDR
ncbi:MAG: flippase-like domain-containing protein [Alphaproteobacteria bacterium]|nr:flippase-like domain-containing protein [Alphaproteobacteria bacterium]